MKTKQNHDLFLMSLIFILLGLGLVAVYSSSAIYALDKFGKATYFFWKQLIWILIGSGSALFFIFFDHKKLVPWIKPFLIISFLSLILVLMFGKEVGGARRWFRLGGISFQPSELVKLALILFVADYADRKKSKIQDFKRGLMPLLIVISLFCGLIFLQPDLGTPILILLVCITMIFISGARWSHLFSLGTLVLLFAVFAVWTKPYRMKRVLAFLNPWEDTRGASYQLVQSLIALGSGGLTGAGVGSSYSKLLYLPEPHTDFVFPIFAEEFGLIGSLTILFLFGLVGWSGFRIASRSKNLFSSLLATGITLMIIYQAVLNIAVVTGCLPTKGLPLPFLSYGGSSLVITLSSVGILLNISRYNRKNTS